ncbi:MAG: SAM-dependent methyltransferase [Treponemataceae bacterium]
MQTETAIEALDGKIFTPFTSYENSLVAELNRELTYRFPHAQKINYGQSIFLHTKDLINDINPYWCKCTFLQPLKISFNSITQAAQILKSMQRNWASIQFTHFRKAALIQDKLPYINTKEKKFPFEIPQSPMGAWMLLDDKTMIASPTTSSPLPAGEINFIEDHENPPSRAYLKFQEALTLFSHYYGTVPTNGELCFDAGACPGGWTWVLTQLGCTVFAVDRSELADSLMKNPLVQFKKHDAFTLKQENFQQAGIKRFHWIFSDVICYPERLLKWIHWCIENDLCDNMICTIKMQGKTDWALIDSFLEIPNSKIKHLNYNKHELTFFYKKA